MRENVWRLSFRLTEFSPAEVERITTLSTTMQRDWRLRGFLPKSGKHARFDALGLAEVLVLKMFADRGIGPQRASVVAPRIAVAVVGDALRIHHDTWMGERPQALFDAIPEQSRALTYSEQVWALHAIGPQELNEFDKADWLCGQLFSKLQVREQTPRSSQVIWWPTDEVVFGQYDNLAASAGVGPDNRPDPRFDGPALVLDIGAVATNLVRRIPRPLISGQVEILSNLTKPPPMRVDMGEIVVTRGRRPVSQNEEAGD